MGQRLCMTIKRKGKPIANAYYHWSGYTGSSYEIVRDVYDYISSNNSDDKKYLAIKALESTGATLTRYDNEFNDIDKLLMLDKYDEDDFVIGNDRNAGLIACFPDSMASNEECAEEFADIDIDTKLINFNVWCYYDSFEEVKEYFDDIEEGDIPTFEFSAQEDLDIGTLKDLVTSLDANTVVQCEDGYYSMIG